MPVRSNPRHPASNAHNCPGRSSSAVFNPLVYRRRMFGPLAVAILVLIGTGIASGQQTAPPTSNTTESNTQVPPTYAEELPRFAPLSPEEAAKSFEILDGFEMELVASEPLVMDPIAFAFDASSRLFVVEMRGYSEQPDERLGRVALLQDTDGDGRMDRRTTFVDNLSWPTAVWPWRDGVLVAVPPKITWYRDQDGDGISDESEDWFVGFGRTNVQGMVNSLRWGVDGYLHGATSSTGAELKQLASDKTEPVSLRRRDFAIDTLEKMLLPTSGGGQHGLSFNRWGDKFVTSNSDHLQQIIDLESWLSKHPLSASFPSVRRSIAVDGPQAEVFRSSPVEPWRIVRTRLRVGGVVSGPVEGGGRAAGYFTGATGTWLTDPSEGFGYQSETTIDGQDSLREIAIVCDVGSNLIHRKVLKDEGLYWQADRIDDRAELLRSSDTWFRPVQLGDGPDGSLYIADMYREVIEHPKSLPPMIKRHLDLTSGRDRGRIWRLRRKRSASPLTTSIDFRELSEQKLAQELSSPNAWRRRTASQLMVEHGISESTTQHLRDVVASGTPEGKILALHIAHRLSALDSETVRLALRDEHARVLEHAIRLVREKELGNRFESELSPLFDRVEPRIALELAALSADLDAKWQERCVRSILPRADEPLLQAVLAASEAGFRNVLQDDSATAGVPQSIQKNIVRLLLPSWLEDALGNPARKAWLLGQLINSDSEPNADWIDACVEPSNLRLAQTFFNSLKANDQAAILQSVLSEIDNRHPTWLALLPSEIRHPKLNQWLDSGDKAQWTALRVIEKNISEDADLVGQSWDKLASENRTSALQLLTETPRGQDLLLTLIETGELQPRELSGTVQTALRSARSPATRTRATKVLGELQLDRAQVVAKYLKAFSGLSDDDSIDPTTLTRGKEHFHKSCSQCHRLDGVGQTVGAGLKQLSDKTPEQLLSSILDPNREVDPRFVSYTMLLDSDLALAGLIDSENSQQVVLIQAGGKKTVVPRNEIVQLTSHGKSLMPIGFEDQLSPDAMFELICYLREARLQE